jgi:hypothetical protein
MSSWLRRAIFWVDLPKRGLFQTISSARLLS